MRSKDALIEDMIKLNTEYNNLHLKIRESNETIKRKLEIVIIIITRESMII